MEKRLRRVYLKTFRGGRSRAAHTVDSIFLFIVTALAIYFVARTQLGSRLVCSVLALFTASVVFIMRHIINEQRLVRHIERLRKDARRRIAMRKLLLLSDDRFAEFVNPAHDTSVMPYRSAEAVSADTVLEAYDAAVRSAKNIVMVACAKPSPAAAELLKELRGSVKVIAPDEHLGAGCYDGIPVDESEIDAELLAKHERHIDIRSFVSGLKLLSRERAVRFLGVGALLMVCSLFMRYSLYFRLLSTLCFAVGGAVYIGGEIRRRIQNRQTRER